MSKSKKDQISVENVELNEYIKDYLKFNGFQTSLECFDSEINAQRMSTKLKNKKLIKNPGSSDNAPRLYSMLKGEESKTQREKLLEEKFLVMNKKYLQLLQASRHIFGISANLITKYSQTQEGQKEDGKKDLENYKKTLIQYRKLVFTESEDPKQECLTNHQIQDLLKQMKSAFEDKDKDKLSQTIASLRNSALNCKYNQREQLIQNLVQEDVLDLIDTQENQKSQSQSENEENDKVNESKSSRQPKISLTLQLLRGYDHFVKTQMLSIISIVLSTQYGQQYFEENDDNFNILNQIIKIYKDQEYGNICQRFCLSIFNKLTISKLLIIHFIDKDLHLTVLDMLKKCKTNNLHKFCSEYGSAVLANIYSDKDVLQSYKDSQKECLEVIQQLIDCLDTKFSVQVNKNILLTLSKFKTEDFNEQLLEVGYDDKINNFLQIISNEWANEFQKQEVLTYHAQLFVNQELKKPDFDEEDMENLREVMDVQKQENAQKKENQMSEKDQFIFFEHFTDEIDHQYDK